MRLTPVARPLAAVVVAAAASIAAYASAPANLARAADERTAAPPGCSCPESQSKSVRPKFADLHAPLDDNDEIAALESVQLALSRMGDNAPLVWRRANGRLAGLVNPTSSYRKSDGTVCRHLVMLLTTGTVTKKAEGVACRLANGRWRLDG